MTAQEVLVEFMKVKSKLLQPPFDLEYFTDEDAADILSWGDSNAGFALDVITNAVARVNINDETTCPFCQVFINPDSNGHMTCQTEEELCGYRERHGICKDSASTYARLIEAGENPCSPVVDNPDLFLDILWKYSPEEESADGSDDQPSEICSSSAFACCGLPQASESVLEGPGNARCNH